jgi:pimeloyl-ACP methyl ester carboxylesterase
VYLVQVNGFGGDAPGRKLGPSTLDGIVADLSAYLDQEKARPVRMVGHSLGGLVGLMFARAHPDQVQRLMVVDALPYFPAIMAPGGEPPTVAAVEPIARTMRDRIAARHGKPVDQGALGAETARLALKPDSQAKILQWAAVADPRVTAQLLYEDMTTDLRAALAEIKTPIMLVYPWSSAGLGKDRTLAFYQRQYAGTPSINYVGIAEAGHFAMLDQPAEFASVIQDFAE